MDLAWSYTSVGWHVVISKLIQITLGYVISEFHLFIRRCCGLFLLFLIVQHAVYTVLRHDQGPVTTLVCALTEISRPFRGALLSRIVFCFIINAYKMECLIPKLQ